jgi:hypothetical protein
MPRPHRSLVVILAAVFALVAIMPGSGALEAAWLEIEWVPLPDQPAVLLPGCTPAGRERSTALAALLPPRAPPLVSAS